MKDRFTQKAHAAIEEAKRTAVLLQHDYVGTEHLLIGLLREKEGVAARVLMENGVDEEKVISLINQLIAPEGGVALTQKPDFTPRCLRILDASQKEAARLHFDKAGTEHLLIVLIHENDSVGVRLLNTLGVNVQKVYIDVMMTMGIDGGTAKNEYVNRKNNKAKGRSMTPTLDRYSRDLTQCAKEGTLDPVVGRTQEIQRVIQILSRRTKNNPCLVGEPGVGKTAIAEGIAQMIIRNEVPETLTGKRLVTLDLSGMVAGSKYRGEFEERIKKMLAEVKADGNLLLFIDEIHTIIGAGGAEGAIDASNILKPSLARGEIQLIGATTRTEYRKHIEKDAALERRFQPVDVEEPSEEETIAILYGLRSRYEEHHGLTISDEAVVAAVKLSSRYINDRFLPDKAIDLMDEAAARKRLNFFVSPEDTKILEDEIQKLEQKKEEFLIKADYKKVADIKKQQEKKEKMLEKLTVKYAKKKDNGHIVVEENDIAGVVSSWTKIPVQKLEEEETERLLHLEETLHRRVIGQEEAVTAIARAIKRSRVGLKDPNRPIGSFLFLGPTGVGKTELSKALAEALFGTENSMIRVDMSEYMEKHSVSKMIGSPPGYVGYEEGGQLSEKVRKNPYSVILFDEIEKAHEDVFNVLLQVLDDGHMTDSQGRKVSFKNTVIIMTSNAGAQTIIAPKNLGFATAVQNEEKNYESMKGKVMEEVKRMFKPEFLNRIDDIVVFHSLKREDIQKIVTLMINEIRERAKNQLFIELEATEAVKDYILTKGYDEKFGARPIRRALQTEFEDKLAEEILKHTIATGDTVTVDMADGTLVFSKKES